MNEDIREKLIDIILKVAMQHHDDVSKTDEDAACDTAEEILGSFSRYICPVEYYPNCRGHDSGYYNGVECFKTVEDLLFYALKYINEYAILDIYDIEGARVGKIEYEISSHRCSGIKITIEDKQYRTIDDGKGKLIWKRED